MQIHPIKLYWDNHAYRPFAGQKSIWPPSWIQLKSSIKVSQNKHVPHQGLFSKFSCFLQKWMINSKCSWSQDGISKISIIKIPMMTLLQKYSIPEIPYITLSYWFMSIPFFTKYKILSWLCIHQPIKFLLLLLKVNLFSSPFISQKERNGRLLLRTKSFQTKGWFKGLI